MGQDTYYPMYVERLGDAAEQAQRLLQADDDGHLSTDVADAAIRAFFEVARTLDSLLKDEAWLLDHIEFNPNVYDPSTSPGEVRNIRHHVTSAKGELKATGNRLSETEPREDAIYAWGAFSEVLQWAEHTPFHERAMAEADCSFPDNLYP